MLYLDTSGLSDTASDATGVSNFCGQYDISIDSSPTAGLLSTWDLLELCEADCGYYNNYTIGTVYPTYFLETDSYDFTVSVSLRDYPLVT